MTGFFCIALIKNNNIRGPMLSGRAKCACGAQSVWTAEKTYDVNVLDDFDIAEFFTGN